MKIMVSNRSFAPYSDLFSSDSILFRYQERTYQPVLLTAINDFSGKVKYYEIELTDKKAK